MVCPPLAKSGHGPARPKTQTETARVEGPSWGWGALPAARGSPGAFLSAPLQAPRRPSRPGLPSSFPPRPAAPALVCSSSLLGLRNYSCLLIHLPWHPSLRAVSPHAAAGKAPKGQVGLPLPGPKRPAVPLPLGMSSKSPPYRWPGFLVTHQLPVQPRSQLSLRVTRCRQRGMRSQANVRSPSATTARRGVLVGVPPVGTPPARILLVRPTHGFLASAGAGASLRSLFRLCR